MQHNSEQLPLLTQEVTEHRLVSNHCIEKKPSRGVDNQNQVKFLLGKSDEALEEAAHGGGGVTIPGGVQKPHGCGTEGCSQWAHWGGGWTWGPSKSSPTLTVPQNPLSNQLSFLLSYL